jgi:hypothetical protein
MAQRLGHERLTSVVVRDLNAPQQLNGHPPLGQPSFWILAINRRQRGLTRTRVVEVDDLNSAIGAVRLQCGEESTGNFATAIGEGPELAELTASAFDALLARLAAACVVVQRGQLLGLRRDGVIGVNLGLKLVDRIEHQEDTLRVAFVLRVEIRRAALRLLGQAAQALEFGLVLAGFCLCQLRPHRGERQLTAIFLSLGAGDLLLELHDLVVGIRGKQQGAALALKALDVSQGAGVLELVQLVLDRCGRAGLALE